MITLHDTSSPLLLLASASPRRAELLRQLGLNFQQVSLNIDESHHHNESIPDYAERMAKEKALAAWQQYGDNNSVILSADTCGEIDGELLSKPRDFDDAKRMLRLLSANTHAIFSSYALYNGETLWVDTVKSTVTFATLTDQQITRYWATGEPCDKAGSYAIQGLGAQFVKHLEGSYSAVMGLPLFELSCALPNFNIRTL